MAFPGIGCQRQIWGVGNWSEGGKTKDPYFVGLGPGPGSRSIFVGIVFKSSYP